MNTIKCNNCGCEMGASSERCPVCGCPVEYVKSDGIIETINIEDDNINNTVSETPPIQSDNEVIENSSEEPVVSNNMEEQDKTEQIYTLDDNSININKDNKESSHENRLLWIFASIVFGVLLISGIVYYNKQSSNNKKSDDTLVKDTIENVEPIIEEKLIIERAEYIFKNLPDHKKLEEVDKSVFSSSFLSVLEKAFELDKYLISIGEGIGFDSAYYWYYGQDGCPNDGLVGISLISSDDTNAFVSVKYRNCKVKEHRLKLIYYDGKWLCDNWDKKKEELANDISEVSNYMELHPLESEKERDENVQKTNNDGLKNRDNGDYEFEKENYQEDNTTLHDFGSSLKRHHLVGTFEDSSGIFPVELDFTCSGRNVSDVIYKNVTLGGKIRMNCTYFDKSSITVEGKDGKYKFVISLKNISKNDFNGIAVDGPKSLVVKMRADCNHE